MNSVQFSISLRFRSFIFYLGRHSKVMQLRKSLVVAVVLIVGTSQADNGFITSRLDVDLVSLSK